MRSHLRTSLVFAVVGAGLALIMYAIASHVGSTSIAYWAKQLLAMFAPLMPLLLVPESSPAIAVSLVVAGNVALYGVLGFVAAKYARLTGVYYGMVALVLLWMLLMTDEWRLYRWLATDDETMRGKTLVGLLGALRWQYFIVAAGLTVTAFVVVRQRLAKRIAGGI